ncbi:hypothetical protein ACFQY9_19770 [Microvirga aerilata]|uniref:hypothetical protein n=1 Tax=Microvirga aerilata TaxID=670292 RepID=UPI0036258EB2
MSLANFHGIGNSLDNIFTALNTYIGTALSNTLEGGAGNDTYKVSTDTTVIENAGEGIDTIILTSVYTPYTPVPADPTLPPPPPPPPPRYVLGDNVENLTYAATSMPGFMTLVGNDIDNVIKVSSSGNFGGAFTIDGGAGADTLIGGNGSDTYMVDNVGDVVTETGDQWIELT